MAKLSEEQAAQLAELEKLRDAPEEPANGGGGLSQVLNISVDLGDPEQVERAFSLGLLTRAEADELEGDGEGEGEGEGEEGPRRRGFFPEAK